MCEVDGAVDEQFDAVTSVGAGELTGTDATAVFPVAEDGKHAWRSGKLAHECVELWERLGPVDRIAGDHDEVGLRGMDLFEQLLLESAHAAHMQVADLKDP